MTSFYRWFIEHVRVPRIPNLGFAGKPGDIWWVFILIALCSYASIPEAHAHPHAHVHYLPLLLIPIEAALGWLVLRWLVANITSEGQPMSLRFNGDVWTYIGWSLLLYLSFITIIGWAWVTTAWMRWNVRHIEGTPGPVVFAAKGWQVLWRTLAFGLGCIFIIPNSLADPLAGALVRLAIFYRRKSGVKTLVNAAHSPEGIISRRIVR